MEADQFRVKVWGSRGSLPAPGPGTNKYGGNTTCIEVRCGDELIILDAGSGIRSLGGSLLAEMPVKGKIIFTHMHWDHIQGFPFFVPAFIPGNQFELYGEQKLNITFENLLQGQMMYPYFPVTMREMAAQFAFAEVHPGDVLNFNGVKVRTFPANHPGGCLTLRIEYKDKVFTFATDVEHYACLDPNLMKACQDADLMLWDACYTDDEYCGKVGSARTGWGHSTPSEGIKVANAAGVKKLVLTHHDPAHNDEFIAKMEEEADKIRPGTQAAFDGMVIDLL